MMNKIRSAQEQRRGSREVWRLFLQMKGKIENDK
jgi:hypothetical protein